MKLGPFLLKHPVYEEVKLQFLVSLIHFSVANVANMTLFVNN
jgi:hypothetical protein